MWNSWGWRSISFQIKSEESSPISTLQRPWKSWTINGSTTFVINPGEHHEFPIDLNNDEWECDPSVSNLKDKTLFIRACFQNEPMSVDELKRFSELPANVPEEIGLHRKRWVSKLARVAPFLS